MIFMKKIKKYFIQTAKMLLFLLRLIIREDFKNHIKKIGANNMCASKKLVLLGNGPSLTSVLNEWKSNGNLNDADVLAVNYFCLDKTLIEIQPKYYVLSDPQFFDKDSLLRGKNT
jgi:hypothetical protein